MIKRIGIICTMMCIYLSCEKSIEVDLPSVDEKIAVDGLFSTNEVISVKISHSKHIFDTTSTFHLENVVVDFYENEVFIETLENKGFNVNGLYFVSPSGFIPDENNSYAIVISATDFKTAFATSTIPEAVPLLRVDTSTVVGELPDWYFGLSDPHNATRPMLECRILFEDPPEVSNYYSLRVENNDYSLMGQIPYVCNDPILEFYNQYSVLIGFESVYEFRHEYFSDKHINGESYELVILLNKNDVRGKIYFRLLSLSKEYYFFKKSVSPSESNQYDPFCEPVQVYSNIHNGVGIFAGASISVDSLNILQ